MKKPEMERGLHVVYGRDGMDTPELRVWTTDSVRPLPSLDAIGYKKKIKAYEKGILSSATPDTYRGVGHVAAIFASKGIDLYEKLQGQTVLDAGSGYGGLAKSAAAEGMQTRIVSLNPRLRDKERKAREEEATTKLLLRTYPHLTPEDLKRIQRIHDRGLVTDFAHDMRRVPSNRFGLVIDYVAVSSYMPVGGDEIYKRYIQELLRVLTPGGEALIYDHKDTALGEKDEDGMPYFKERVLNEMGQEFFPLVRGHGAIIRKEPAQQRTLFMNGGRRR
jgi:SAM-dependent methyltransferase